MNRKRGQYEQFYANKFENFYEMGKFLSKTDSRKNQWLKSYKENIKASQLYRWILSNIQGINNSNFTEYSNHIQRTDKKKHSSTHSMGLDLTPKLDKDSTKGKLQVNLTRISF